MRIYIAHIVKLISNALGSWLYAVTVYPLADRRSFKY